MMTSAFLPQGSWLQQLFLFFSSEVTTAARVEPGPSVGYVDSLQSGDQDAWRLLFEEESPAIYRYALSRLGVTQDAEDVTNHVFEEAWRSIERYRDEGLPLRAWLFGIARNLARSHRRRFMRGNPQISIDGLQLEGKPDAAGSDMIDLVEAIASLGASQAETISLRYVHGLSLAETAAVLGTTVDGVKGRQQRALANLKSRLNRD